MSNVKKRLGDHLMALRLITPEQLEKAVNIQKESPEPLGSILVKLGFLKEEMLLNALAAQMGVTPWRLELNPPTRDALKKLPANICRTYQVLPVALRSDLLILAMRNPLDLDAIDLVRNFSGLRVEPTLAEPDRLSRVIDQIHGQTAQKKMDNLVNQVIQEHQIDVNEKSHREQLDEVDTRPVVGLVNQILSDAIRMGASDVHIEPRADRVELRFRIDGELLKMREIPSSLHRMLTTRIKIMAEMDIVEYRMPQDGRVNVEVDNREVDMRVSTLPSQHGQRIVLRILDRSMNVKSLDEVGFTEHQLRTFRTLVRKPYGILLVTGPTGSGKTTTLYGALTEMKKSTRNIMTCEDPIEYEMDGINQSQMNEKVGLTFAAQIRAMLRQDPDIIMVGEIRDGETAETAIRASLTGHLVVSTLHCNDAPSAVPRLLDMGIDPFLLGTCLIGVGSQRLLRCLCTHCRVADKPSDEEVTFLREAGLDSKEIPMLWRGVGCPRCNHTGYKGRTAVHELLPVVPEVSKAISERESVEVVRAIGHRYGYEEMPKRAIQLVLEGRTSLDEAQKHVFFETLSDYLPASADLRVAS